MAAQFHQAPIVQRTETIIPDKDGNEIMRITVRDIFVRHPNGVIEKYKQHQHIALRDGTIFHVGMLVRDPPADLAVCDLCRAPPLRVGLPERPTHGLIRLSNARTCDCGNVCCAAHRKTDREGNLCCLRCARSELLIRTLLFPFFVKR